MRKVYDFTENPIEVHGVPFWNETHRMERVPQELRERLPSLEFLGRRTPGARVCFRTNSPTFTVRISFETLGVDVGMAIYACQSANVMIGERKNARYAAIVNPVDYQMKVFEKTVEKNAEMEEVTIFLPRNEIIENVEIGIEADARIEPPTPYQYALPVLFYGSSITEGGCCTRPTNAYPALLSSRLDFDFYNFGFSGSARGELEMADYINTIPMSVFVYDYDHNAPDAAHLAATHEPFFQRIREKNPYTPVLFLTRPDFDYDPASPLRRDVIYKTYSNALANGDRNVFFLDGETFFGETDRENCTVDRCHPNDLGFMRMADRIEPVLREALSRG